MTLFYMLKPRSGFRTEWQAHSQFCHRSSCYAQLHSLPQRCFVLNLKRQIPHSLFYGILVATAQNYLRNAGMKNGSTIVRARSSLISHIIHTRMSPEHYISGIASANNATAHRGYCLQQMIPALLMTKKSMKLILQLFPLSCEFNQSKLFNKKVNKKIQEMKHQSGNLLKGEEHWQAVSLNTLCVIQQIQD